MKNNIPYLLIIVISLVLFSIATRAQYTTIKTPTNVTVEAIAYTEYSLAQLALIDSSAADWIDDHDSEAVKVADASGTYNCHNYAWHNSDGGSRFWVNQNDRYSGANISKYWSGLSATYQQTTSASALKVFYSNGDHSARVISSSLFESKWGAWPRYRHSPADCPYVSSNLQYYIVPINGDDIVCTSKTYSLVNILNATYNWSSEKLSTSGAGYSTTATKTSDGFGWIKCQMYSPYSGTTVYSEQKTICVGSPQPGTISIDMDSPPRRFTASIDEVSYATSYNWYIDGGLNNSYHGTSAIFNRQSPYCGGSYYVQVEEINSCGTSSKAHTTAIEPMCLYSLVFTPNPATDFCEVEIVNESGEAIDEQEEWSMEVYDQGQKLKLKKEKQKGKNTVLDVAGWKEGIYLVQVNLKDQQASGKLVVKK